MTGEICDIRWPLGLAVLAFVLLAALIGEHRDLGSDVDAVLLLDQAVERIFADGSSLYYYLSKTKNT